MNSFLEVSLERQNNFYLKFNSFLLLILQKQ